MKERIIFLLKFYFVQVALFAVYKVLFLLLNAGEEPFSVTDVFAVAINGLPLDFAVAGYFSVIPLIVTIATIFLQLPLKKIIQWYSAIISMIITLALVADMSLYPYWEFKLDASFLIYIDSPANAIASISIWHLLATIIIFTVCTYGIYRFLTATCRDRFSPCNKKSVATIVSVLLGAILFLGIRGGVTESTNNIGTVFYSDRQILNHSALNPIFSFLYSVGKIENYSSEYSFVDEKECSSIIENLYCIDNTVCDTLIKTTRPNIIIIIMEGMSARFVEKLGGMKSITPNIDRLIDEGVLFTNCYANSYRTDRGVICTLSGYPSFPKTSVMKSTIKSQKLPSVALSLGRAGYTNTFLYGGDINFTNMKGYLYSTGYHYTFADKNFSSAEQESHEWGVGDDITFNRLYDVVMSQTKEPWHITHLTLSSHEPWNVPYDRISEDKIANSFAFTDEQLGKFIDRLKKTDKWENTLVVCIPDHSVVGYPKGIKQTDRERNHIPLLMLGGAVKRPMRIERLCNQTDMAATLLAQLNLPIDEFTFSRNVLGQNYNYPFAYHSYNNGISLIDSTGFTVYDLDSHSVIHESPKDNSNCRLNNAKVILQATYNNYMNK